MGEKHIRASGQYNEGGKGWVQPKNNNLLRPDYYLHPGYGGGGHHLEANGKRLNFEDFILKKTIYREERKEFTKAWWTLFDGNR